MKRLKEWVIKFKIEHPMIYDIVTRALWTFAQATLASIVIAPGIEWKSMIIGAIGAGLSAAKTVVIDALQRRSIEKDGVGDA